MTPTNPPHRGEGETRDANPYASPSPASIAPTLPPKLSLPLAVVLIAITIGAFAINVGLGIGVALVAVPSYIRAASISVQRIAAGQSISTTDRVLGFFGSLAVVVWCAAAGVIAFFITCTAGLLPLAGAGGGQSGLALLILLSTTGCLVAAGLLYYAFWPYRGK